MDSVLLDRLLDPLTLASFVRYLCVFFVLELLRRVVQSGRNAFDDLRLVATSFAALFVLLWPVAFSKENTYSLPLVSVAMVITAYIAFMESPWGLTFRQRIEVTAKDRRIGVAAGLADVLFGFAENSYDGQQAEDAVKRYLIESELNPAFCNIANFWPPLILFPDLTSDYYRDLFEDEEKNVLVSGLVNAEREERKAKSEKQVVALCQKYHYEYEVKGVKRNSHYDVIRYNAWHPRNNNAEISHYFSVIDNRQLNSLKMVGLSSGCEVRLSREEFGVEVEKMKARVTELMTEKFGEKCRILTVKGRLSDVLRDLVKTPITTAGKRAKKE